MHSFVQNKAMYKTSLLPALIVSIIIFSSSTSFAQIVLKTPHVNSVLFTGKGLAQPLIVGLGGSEGGNAWAGSHWKKTRDQLLEKGYAFLALGYFAATGAPDSLDRIAVEDIHRAIMTAASTPGIDKNKIAIIGGSRGADLALLLASYYTGIRCVVGIVASNCVFPGNTSNLNTSSWTWRNKPLPFVPVNEAAVPFLMRGDLRETFATMLKDSSAAEKAAIHVERINGPVLFLSATKDEISPSTPMAENMMAVLKNNHFKYHYAHIAVEGGHTAPLQYMNVVIDFIEKYFPVQQQPGCSKPPPAGDGELTRLYYLIL
jgi:uncharacterized protein